MRKHRVIAQLSGEIAVQDVPVTSGIDVEALKSGDEEPLEIVVEVPASKSKRGWNYSPKSVQSIVTKVMKQGLPGFLGHQKAEDVSTQFPTPVTHWVGAKWDPAAEIKSSEGKVIGYGKGYFRGVVDKSSPDLKRWVKSGAINTVSIFGYPSLKKAAGETEVTDYDALSIDWTPLGRAGMDTAIVATGEMDSLCGELDGSFDETTVALREAIKSDLGNSSESYIWLRKVWPDHVVVAYEDSTGNKLYDYTYGIVDDEIQLGNRREVKENVQYVAAEMEVPMDKEKLLLEMKKGLDAGTINIADISKTMGWTAKQVAGEMDATWLSSVDSAKETLDKVKQALGVSGEMDVVATAEKAAEAIENQKQQDMIALIDGVLAEKVNGEMAQSIVKRMLHVSDGATKEQIAGEIDTILKDDGIQSAISKLFTDSSPGLGGQGKGQAPRSLRVKRTAI